MTNLLFKLYMCPVELMKIVYFWLFFH